MEDLQAGRAKIAAALAAFQAEMPTVHKGKTAKVGSYSYTYADLADVTEAAMPLLSKHGLAYTCTPDVTEHGLVLRGTLLHTSGERIVGTLPISGKNAQELGSALTYMRRYLFGCLTGLVTDDDDDGQLAQQAKRQQARKPPAKKAAAAQETGEALSQAQSQKMHATFNELGITERDDRLRFVREVIGRDVESSKDLTKSEATKVIDALVKRQEQPFPTQEPSEEDPWA
jgi:hypothetical protein